MAALMEDAAGELRSLIAKATAEDLSDGGRYFAETYDDLTRCRHEEIGEYQHATDGELIEWLWNRRNEIADLYAAHSEPSPVAGESFLSQLRRVNTDRYHAWVGNGQDAGILFDAAELGGEVGELLNVVKKLEREKRGWRGSRAASEDFADECGDVLICLDKLARRRGVDLEAATVAKFNATSDKVDLPHKLATHSPAPTEAGEVERLREALQQTAGYSDENGMTRRRMRKIASAALAASPTDATGAGVHGLGPHALPIEDDPDGYDPVWYLKGDDIYLQQGKSQIFLSQKQAATLALNLPVAGETL